MDYLCSHKTTGLVGSQLYPCPLRSSKLKHPNSLLRDASLTWFLISPVIMRYLNVSQHFCIHSWRAFAVSDLSFCLMQRKPIVSLPPILDKKNRLVPASQQPPSMSHLVFAPLAPSDLRCQEPWSFSLLPPPITLPKTWHPELDTAFHTRPC